MLLLSSDHCLGKSQQQPQLWKSEADYEVEQKRKSYLSAHQRLPKAFP